MSMKKYSLYCISHTSDETWNIVFKLGLPIIRRKLSHVDTLEKVRRRATKLVKKFRHSSYEDRLKKLNQKAYSLVL